MSVAIERNRMRSSAVLLSSVMILFACAMLLGSAAPPSPTPTDTPVPPLTVYPRAGNPAADPRQPHGPGLVLMGGGHTTDPALVWMHDTIVGSHAKRGGDIVVLTAGSGNDYTPYLMDVAPFNSVRSIMIGPGATAADLRTAAAYVDHAQGVFFSGGDQAHYVKWKGTPIAAAVQRVYDRGGVVGGTSAGLAILGEYVYDSVAADAVSDETIVDTDNAMADPAEPIISFTHDFLAFPPLRGVITDTHFVTRNRLGRLIVFLARLQAQTGRSLLGLGIEQSGAVVVDRNGIGTLLQEQHRGEALLVRLGPERIAIGHRPFHARAVTLTLVSRNGQHIDFNRWCALGPTYTIDVDGSRKPYYSVADPYVAPPGARIAACPPSGLRDRPW